MDVNDYREIATMIARVESKIDALRKEVVTTDMQALVNKSTQDDIDDVKKRLDALENAPGIWLLRLGVIASIAISTVELLAHIRLLP